MRGYSFNINSGAVESLELDSFGISFIPSSLVGEEVVLHNNSITVKAYYSKVVSILIRIVCSLQFQVSTYALFVEDVLEVVADAIIVHEAAASRIHRLTKVLFCAQ